MINENQNQQFLFNSADRKKHKQTNKQTQTKIFPPRIKLLSVFIDKRLNCETARAALSSTWPHVTSHPAVYVREPHRWPDDSMTFDLFMNLIITINHWEDGWQERMSVMTAKSSTEPKIPQWGNKSSSTAWSHFTKTSMRWWHYSLFLLFPFYIIRG